MALGSVPDFRPATKPRALRDPPTAIVDTLFALMVLLKSLKGHLGAQDVH